MLSYILLHLFTLHFTYRNLLLHYWEGEENRVELEFHNCTPIVSAEFNADHIYRDPGQAYKSTYIQSTGSLYFLFGCWSTYLLAHNRHFSQKKKKEARLQINSLEILNHTEKGVGLDP
jgi:hypothetical protein